MDRSWLVLDGLLLRLSLLLCSETKPQKKSFICKNATAHFRVANYQERSEARLYDHHMPLLPGG